MGKVIIVIIDGVVVEGKLQGFTAKNIFSLGAIESISNATLQQSVPHRK
jgi:hypothetical protein